MSLRILKPGVYTTVQDFGRAGHGAAGVPVGGAADRVSLSIANRLVGNADDAAGVEMTLVGATIAFEHDTTIALAGATPSGAAIHHRLAMAAGTTLVLGPLAGGARTYLAVAGGIDVEPALGSRSTHAASGLGGHEGRALRALDVLRTGRADARTACSVTLDVLRALQGASMRRRLRIVPGAQAAALGAAAMHTLLGEEFTVSDRSDRVGLRLTGPTLGATSAGEMITEPTTPGAIQVPPDGAPIILGPDAPVTGGYPVIASVIAADLPALGQLGPRERVTFELVMLSEAIIAYRTDQSLLVGTTNNPA